jgi:transcriptional regulator with XRE-family HTH domain
MERGKMLSMESFSNWLLAELQSRDMSQSDLAHIAKLGSGTISNIMTGNRKVGQDTLTKIAHALKLPPDFVFEKAGIINIHAPKVNPPPNDDLPFGGGQGIITASTPLHPVGAPLYKRSIPFEFTIQTKRPHK